MLRSTGGVFFPDFNDLLEAFSRRGTLFAVDILLVSLSLSLKSAAVLVGVIVGAGETGEIGVCISCVGVGITCSSTSSEGTFFEVVVVVREGTPVVTGEMFGS